MTASACGGEGSFGAARPPESVNTGWLRVSAPRRHRYSAMGDRQMLPVQMNSVRTSSSVFTGRELYLGLVGLQNPVEAVCVAVGHYVDEPSHQCQLGSQRTLVVSML